MPLSRQLVIIVSLVLSLGFVGAFLINVYDTRAYVAAQLESHAQDAATSLGVSISQHLATGDVVHAESFVDAIFDRGYYRQIVVEDLDGQHLIERVVPMRMEGIPTWFTAWLPLTTPRAMANIQAGWQQAGQVTVISHPGFAYEKLWTAAVKTFWWCFALFAVSAGTLALAVQKLLRPLEAVERQAISISNRQFERLDDVPRTRELARVVNAMNGMVEHVERMVTEQHEEAERLRDEVFIDPVTGLGNSRAFERSLATLVGRREEHAFGAVLAIRFADLDLVNRAASYEAGDELLRAAADRLRERLESESFSVARLGGALFAVVLADLDREAAEQLARDLASELGDITVRDREPGGVNVGLAWYNGAQSAEDLAANAQTALRNAEQEGRGTWHAFAPAETAGGPEIFEQERWRGLLETAIDKVSISLLAQPVRAVDGSRTLHREILARIRDEKGETVPAGVFFPMAARLGLTTALDRLISEATIWHLKRHPDAAPRLAVNLAGASVADRTFNAWLLERLEAEPAVAQVLAFEITAHTARSIPEDAQRLGSALRALGAELGLDHVGASELRRDEIRRLAPDYIKIDGAFVNGLDEDRDRQIYVRSLVSVGHALESLVIAEFVENESELQVVRRLGFDGVQGHHIGGPERLRTT